MVKLNIRQKILALVLVITVIPFTLMTIYWVNLQRQTILKYAKETQIATTNEDADDVSLFVSDEVRALIYRAQDMALHSKEKNNHDIKLDLQSLIYQDANIVRLAKVDKNGQESVAIGQNGINRPIQNVRTDPAFQAVKNYDNKYISSAIPGPVGHPLVTIAIPIPMTTEPKVLASLSDNIRPAGSQLGFSGALIAQIDFQVLWTKVLKQSVNAGVRGNYAFVVDEKGNVIAYPDQKNSGIVNNLSTVPIVAEYIKHLGTAKSDTDQRSTKLTISEKGAPVLATYQKINAADWAIVVEDPTSLVYKDINDITVVGLVIALVAVIIFIVISYGLSKFITDPILRIADIAGRIGHGDFNARVTGRRHDEIGKLGESINTMGQDLKVLVGRIEDQRHQVEAILDNTTDAILSVDDQGKIIIANKTAKQLFEFNNESLSGRQVGDLLKSIHAAKPFILDFALLSPGISKFTDLTYQSPSKKTRYIDIVLYKIMGTNDGAIANQTILTIHDETKRRELEHMKLEFVAMAAHELRTPLTSVLGYLELVLGGNIHETLSDKVNNYLTRALYSGRELGTLINNLLDVTRLEHGTIQMKLDRDDIAKRILDTVNNSQYDASTKKIKLIYTGPVSDCFVIADPTTLQEVLNNLVDNAIKYTPQEGFVSISLVEKNGSYIIKVRDSGIGIPASALPNLFKKFYRVQNGLENGSTGTGLGLYLSKAILEKIDGTISVKSEEGKGSEFTVILPLYNEARRQEMISSQQLDDKINKT